MGVPLNQLVMTEAAAALMLMGAARGGLTAVLAAGGAAGLLGLTWVRVRGRWAFAWLGVLARFTARRRGVAIGSATELLALAAPRARLTEVDLPDRPVAILADDLGLTMLLDVDSLESPPLAGLLPAGRDRPPIGMRLLLAGIPAATGSGPAADSYRMLAVDRPPALFRTVLVVRAFRAGDRSEAELRRALWSLGRKLGDRLGARPLDEAAALRAMADFAHAEAPGTATEAWNSLRLGDLAQATFDCRPAPPDSRRLISHPLIPRPLDSQPSTSRPQTSQPPNSRPLISRVLISRLLGLPAAVTVAVTTTGLVVRLAAPDATALESASGALERLLAAEHLHARRCAGVQLPGLLATLPLPGPPEPGMPAVDAIPSVPAGLMLGGNRHGHPVPVRLFRPEPTTALLIGGVRCAQLLVFRALGTGARVLIHTTRPREWEPFLRAAVAPVLLGAPEHLPAGSPRHPVLAVLDNVPATAVKHPWQTALTVRDDPDAATAARADLVLLQPLSPPEATLLGTALGLGDTGRLLTRMPPGMVAVVDRATVRWAALTPTPMEKVLIGDPVRTIDVDM